MEKIFVSVRVRPLSKAEAAKGSPWKLGSKSITLCNPSGAPVPGQSYVFDRVFGSETSTSEIYETHTKDIIASAVKGFNGTVFAYGQTSSGKTYTMRGTSQEPGIIPLAIQEIFRNIQEAEDREFLLRVSYMEIYNEEINDLLAPDNRKLQIHENLERGIFVAGLREEIVVNPEQVLDLMTAGETYRHVGETNMNVYSSRSHSIFRMVIESRDRSHDDPAGPATVQSCDAVRVSVLNLVDLAGSERVAKTGAEGARLKEGTHINKSLMTLGTVINKLSEGVEKQGGHVPYRDSKLTRILQSALGGNAKTAVICNITPAQIHVDETKGTLFFASRANRVTNCAEVNEIMTDAALLKRQQKEILELRNKLQENHSDHWDAEILNLRNALLKTELERERMALELQQEKKAQAERERLLKEQKQKIENLSTMVINSAVDDRDLDRRNKKNNRRETWCPRIPSVEPNEKLQENKKPFPKESPIAKSMFSRRGERLPPLPPPFASLMEGEDTVPPLLELDENTLGEEFQSFPSASSNLDLIFQEPPPVFFCERKRRSSEQPIDEELRQQLEDLQAQYDDLQLQHELNQHEMREKMLEMKELKEELAFAQSAVNKARKLDNVSYQSEDRRGKSLDGWESDANINQLRAQIQNLELEKIYMQKELDTLKVQATAQANSADFHLKELQQELEEAREDGANARVDLSIALQQIADLQQDQQSNIDQQAALATHFNELTLEVETTKSSSQAFFEAAVDSKNALRVTLMNLQESIIDVKSLRAAAENQHFKSLQSDLEALMKEHDSLFSVLQTVEKERDAFCEVSKLAQAGLKSLEEEIRKKTNELDAAATELLAANKHIVDASNEIAELQSLLTQREGQQQALEQSIRELEREVMGAISKSRKDKLEERIAELEQELELVSRERSNLICKGEAMHATIQILEGERDALIETSKQAQADIDRLQGKRRQELKEAQTKLEVALSESHIAKEQLIAMRSLLTEKTEEQQALQFKLENLQREATTSTTALEESVRALESKVAHKSTELEVARREYGELVAIHEALNREKCEISSRSEDELNRLCRELDSQGQELAEAEKRLEFGQARRIEDEKQLSQLHLTLSKQGVEIEALQREVANLTAEKCAMETCLAGQSPDSINSVLVEKSLQLSGAECSLQANMAELEKIKHECALLQDLRVTLESDLVKSRSYSVAVEETLSEAVSALEAKNQENLNLKADLENALKESELKSAKLADIENECTALVESIESIKLEMEDAKVTWEQEVQNQKDSNEAVRIEQVALVEECKSLRCALVSLEEEREVLKEQNFQAETELKEFDVEVQRQRHEIEVAERDLDVAKHESMRAAEIIAELREAFSQKTNEIVFLQTQIQALGVETSSLEDNLEKEVQQLELVQKREDTLILEKNVLVERMNAAEQSLRGELEKKIQDLVAAVSNLEAENLEVHEKLKQSELHLKQSIEEKDRISKEIEVLLDGTKQLQDKISCLELEGKQMESRLASATSEIDGSGKQLNDVHALLTENQKERLVLQQSLEELENCKAGLQKSLRIKDAELASTSADHSEIKLKFEAFQQQHYTESSQLKSDILGLRKELKAAKAAPASLEKERDGMRKDLEKLKTKLGDIEAKLKSALIEKSKVETEKLNIEREVKQLRQSTALLNKRESIVDKRRESVACGLNKTKQQLSSTEHALQMKINELEKTAFDLQLLQDNYAKLEADMVETENASVLLKEKLAEAESAISVLKDEKGSAICTIEKMTQELENEMDQKSASVAQLEALRREHMSMTEKFTSLQVASEKAEAEMKSISLDLARQLTDAHLEFGEEKDAWASQVDQGNARVQELQQEIVILTEELHKVQKSQDEIVAVRNTLQEQLDEVQHTAKSDRVALQEQVSTLEQCLESSSQESKQLRQQVELLNSSVEEQVGLQRKLEEEMFAGKEQYKALTEEFEKLKELLVVSEAAIQKEKQLSVGLAEEIKELKGMLQQAELKCADLYERNSDSEAAVEKESNEMIQLLEERRALEKTVQSQADRCMVLEGQISQLEVNLREGCENNSKLLQEIQELKEKLHNDIEVSTQQQKSEENHRVLELEAAWNNDREVAKKQVEKLQSQLKMSHTEIESLQTELDDVGMEVKSLHLEVDDLQAAVHQSRTEKFTLKQQLSDLTARLSSLEDKNEQLQKKETHLLQLNKAYLTSKTKLRTILNSSNSRLEYFQSLCEKMEEAILEMIGQKNVAKKENDGLLVKLQNLRSRCQRYEEELKDAKSRRTSPEEEQVRESQIAEIMQQNSALQLRLAKAEENAKARREEMTELYEVVQRKEESTAKLEAALEKAQGQVLMLERDLYQKTEPQTKRKADGSTLPSGEFITPMAYRQRKDDENHTDDTIVLYNNSLDSRSKVEQLKLQSQSLLRMAANKHPWRIQSSPGGSMDEADDHPPPSATLHSHHENLTAPIPTWKRAKTSGAPSNTDFLQPSGSSFSEDKLLVSSFNSRSVPRAALLPVTQNKSQSLGLKRRLQETGTIDKLLVQGIDEAGTKPSVSSSQMPRNFRLNQRCEKENL